MAEHKLLTFAGLNQKYEGITAAVTCECTFATDLVGGQPATADGVRAFVRHYLKLEGAEAEAAAGRILKEEVGTKDKTPENGELDEAESYGVNIIRRSEHGPWLGNWMIKANLKSSASRLGIFQAHRGSKGDFAEAGRVQAVGISLLEPEHPERVYLIGPDGKAAATEFQEFAGRVSTPQGSVSIIHHSETVPPGTRFAFEYRFLQTEVDGEEIELVLALAMIVGLGSVKSLERGKYRIERAELAENKYSKRKRKDVTPKPSEEGKESKTSVMAAD